jgi:hypothetical protein
MKIKSIDVQFKHARRRCVELYSPDTPVRPKRIDSKKLYQRHPRNQATRGQGCDS